MNAFDIKPEELDNLAEIFEKAAEYIEELQAKIQEKEEAEHRLQNSEHLDKLAGLGFSEDELKNLSTETLDKLTKMAGSAEPAWEIGAAYGVAAEDSLDPFTQFLLK